MKRVLFALTVLALTLSGAGSALAQIAISNTPATSPALGVVVRGSSTTTFSISTGGIVSRTSGNAIRLSTASVTPPTVTITCGTNSNCRNRDVRITVTASGALGSGSLSLFRVGTLTGASYRTSAPTEAASLTFDLRPLGSSGSASFPLGMDVLLAAGANSGAATFTYTVTATFL